MNREFFIFKLEKTKGGNERRTYLTAGFTWSKDESKAYKADFEAMKAIAGKIKDENPSLIIERQCE